MELWKSPGLWQRLNDGYTAATIKKNKPKVSDLRNLDELVERMSMLGTNETLTIMPGSMLLPLSVPAKDPLGYWNYFQRYRNMPEEEFASESWQRIMDSEEFRGNGLNYRLGILPGEQARASGLGPQHLMMKSMNDAGVPSLPFSSAHYQLIARRGFAWSSGSSGKALYKILGFRDLMRGWNVASILINEGYEFPYSQPPTGFRIELPSTTAQLPDAPTKAAYSIRMSNFAEILPCGYSDWPKIEGDLSGQQAGAGKDMSTEKRRITLQGAEWNIDFRFVAASILRQHVNDERRGAYGIHKPARPRHQETPYPIPPVQLNIALPPSNDLVEFYFRILNNVLVGKVIETQKGRKVIYEKPNVGQIGAMLALAIYKLKPEQCFKVDERLDSIDQTVSDFRQAQLKYFPGYQK